MSRAQENSLKQAFIAEDAAQMDTDIALVLDTAPGRRLLIAIVDGSGIYEHTKPGDNLDYLAGRRDAALEILSAVNRKSGPKVILARQERNQLMADRATLIRQSQQNDKKMEERKQ